MTTVMSLPSFQRVLGNPSTDVRHPRQSKEVHCVGGVFTIDQMKHLLLILLLMFSVGVGAYDEGDFKRFKAINKCPNCDLSGANFSGRDMKKATLKGANLSDANLSRANLLSADLSGANLQGANLTQAKVWLVSFRGANLSGANLSELQTIRADFSNADLTDTNIEEADFSRAILCNTKTPWGIENSGCK